MSLGVAHPQKRSLIERLAAIDDGAILRTAFFVMLIGAVSVLTLDYLDLNAENDALPDPANIANPVLPAVDRPEIDPESPAFRPTEQITTPQEVLSAPLEIGLGPQGVLYLTGTIMPGSAIRLAEEFAQRGDYIETVALDSPGGAVEEALAMGRAIRAAGFDTFVGAGSLCASSCPLLLAGGVNRTVESGASVGVHQIYAAANDTATLGSAQAMSDAQSVTARIVRYLLEMDIDTGVWVHALETPPNRLYYLTGADLAAYGLNGAELADAG